MEMLVISSRDKHQLQSSSVAKPGCGGSGVVLYSLFIR